MLLRKIKMVIVAGFMMFTCLNAQPITAYASERTSTLIQMDFNLNTTIYGLTAVDDLGKKTGTLEEFARAMSNESTENYATFPVNYFHAYDNVKDVIGGIYSQGEVIHDSWLDFGCGFDSNNRFHLFKLSSTLSNELTDGKIIIADNNGDSVEIVTAFNAYPWLIKDGSKLEIEPTPAADERFLNSKALRGFMGQTADGTFMYGIVNSATIYELQEICSNLGLTTAVNTDGGASAGAYQNGSYLARSGRELASVIYIAQGQGQEVKTEIHVILNGTSIAFPDQQPVMLNERVLVPVGELLNALGADVAWDGQTQTVTATKDGTVVELQINTKTAKLNGVDVLLDVEPTIINSRTMLPARFITESFGANVSWDTDMQAVIINHAE